MGTTLAVVSLITISLIGIVIYSTKLYKSLSKAPHLSPNLELMDREALAAAHLPSVSLIIPAYNEAENLEDCVAAVLRSTELSSEQLEVWVVDDQSTDATLAIAQHLEKHWGDPRLKVLPGQPRPTDQTWVGKNWACTQAVQQAKGKFLLFIDADVRLKLGAVETTLQEAEREQVDLLSCAPVVICGCLAEWLVQPIVINLLSISVDFAMVNDPTTKSAFAVGPFMLFRRSAYEQIGGHRSVADQVVEDVELARRVKENGLKLRYLLGLNLAAVRMYSSWAALWEGWTKNLYLGSRRNLGAMINLSLIMVVIYPLPWIGLILALLSFNPLAIGLGSIAVMGHYSLRRLSSRYLQIPCRYWWLSGLGGILIALIALASVVKTETGRGWTWRGRQLR